MSFTTTRKGRILCDGPARDAAITLYSQGHRPSDTFQLQNFLRRARRRKLSAFSMGNTFSKYWPSNLSTSKLDRETDNFESRSKRSLPADGDEEEEDPRLSKRRRLEISPPRNSNNTPTNDETPTRFTTVGQIFRGDSARQPSKLGQVQPADFYGSSMPGTASQLTKKPSSAKLPTKFRINDLLLDNSKFQEALRVNVSEFLPSDPTDQDAWRIPQGRSVVDISCRVTVTVWSAHYDESSLDESSLTPFTSLSKKSMKTTLRVSQNTDSGTPISRQFINLEPFYFIHDEIYVKRKLPRQANGRFGRSYLGLADEYRISVDVESIGSGMYWPPLIIPENSTRVQEALENDPVDDFRFYGEIKLMKSSSPPKMRLKFVHHLSKQMSIHQKKVASLPYVLDLEAAWSVRLNLNTRNLPHYEEYSGISDPHAQEVASSPKDSTPVNSARNPPVNSQRENSVNMQPVEDDANEESPTKQRARRERTAVSTYNLKALSSFAQGKSPRKRKAQFSDTSAESKGITVTYDLGKAEAAESGVKREITVPGLMCPFCDYQNETSDDLRFHLDLDHGAFKFHLRRREPRMLFFVEYIKPRPGFGSKGDISTTIQLKKPTTIFELEKYLSGEKTWLKTRQGPLHDQNSARSRSRTAPTSSPRASGISSPNISNISDDQSELHPAKRRLLVPHTIGGKPLFDEITKKLLVPGEELPNQSDPADERAVHRKHCDMVNDFEDVTDEEKDYINEWNLFILPQRLSPMFMPEAVLRFCELKKEWFAEKKSRKRELLKHISVLILRGHVDEEIRPTAMNLLRPADLARKARENSEKSEEETTSMQDDAAEPEAPVAKAADLSRNAREKSEKEAAEKQKAPAAPRTSKSATNRAVQATASGSRTISAPSYMTPRAPAQPDLPWSTTSKALAKAVAPIANGKETWTVSKCICGRSMTPDFSVNWSKHVLCSNGSDCEASRFCFDCANSQGYFGPGDKYWKCKKCSQNSSTK